MRATLACVTLLGGLVAAAAAPKEDKPPPIKEKDIEASQENLKQIGIAFHAFHDKNGYYLPVDIVDKKGNPLLSWRVAILSHVGEEALFKSFRFDEPWDGPNNKKLIEKMPKIYAPVRVKAKAGETFYQTFTGKDAVFGPGKLLLRIPTSFPDGLSNTALAIEAGEPVVWTKPADIEFDAKNPVPKLGGLFDGECNVVMCDGRVFRLKKDRDETAMKLLVMPNDGLPTQLEKLIK